MIAPTYIKDSSLFLKFDGETLHDAIGSYGIVNEKDQIMGHSSLQSVIKDGKTDQGDFEVWKCYKGFMRVVQTSSGTPLPKRVRVKSLGTGFKITKV